MGIERIGGGSVMSSMATTATSNTPVKTRSAQSNANIEIADVPGVRETMTNEDVTVNQSNKDKNSQSNTNGKDGANSTQAMQEVDSDKVKSAVENANKGVLRNTSCSFRYDEDTKRISITVKDKDTDEVIKEIPSEKALDMLAKAWELAGLMVDEKR